MDVLLVQVDVDPKDMIGDPDTVNQRLAEADVVLVVGANDTVNSGAETDPNNALYGMPIFQMFVCNREIFVFFKLHQIFGLWCGTPSKT